MFSINYKEIIQYSFTIAYPYQTQSKIVCILEQIIYQIKSMIRFFYFIKVRKIRKLYKKTTYI